jgi:hypothetical protein
MKISHMFLPLVLALGVGSSWATPPSKDPIYRGTYFYNFENSSLTPDGMNEAWCIDADMSAAMLAADKGSQPWGTAYVVVRGKLGPQGHFGGLGRCRRVLEVSEILVVKNKRGRI